jgi:hypothetical protein
MTMDPAVLLADSGPPLPPPDTSGPTMTVTGWPTDPIRPGDTVPLAVVLADPSGIKDVALFIDGVEHERDSAAPYVLTFSRDLPGDYGVTVVGTDTLGNQTIVGPQTIDVELPPPPPQPDVTLILRAGLTHEVKQA